MAKNTISISGSISSWNWSSRYFKWCLDDCDKGPVTVYVNSFGGDVNEAIAIGNMIKDHGDITVEYIAYNASAATLLGIYAKKAIIRSDALFMIHKTSVWIDTWGQLNEDQIEAAIEDLKASKQLAEASTLQIAKIYAAKSSKSVSEILNMMKEAKWLTPEQAVENGFVDEVLPVREAKKANATVAAMFAANGLNLPEDHIQNNEEPKENLGDKLLNAIRDGFNSLKGKKETTTQTTMETKFKNVNSLLNIEGVEMKDGKISLTAQQIEAIENRLNEQQTTADAHSTMVEGLNALDESINSAVDKVTAVKNLLEKKPANSGSSETGKDNHDDHALDYTPDPVNDFVKTWIN